MTAAAPPRTGGPTTRRAPPRTPRRPARRRAVLLTGVGSPLGRALAARLDPEPAIERLLGLDYVCPDPGGGRLEVQPIDLLTSDLETLLRAERVQAVVHLLWVPEELDRRGAYRVNVLGARRLIAAAARAEVRHVVLASSTEVFGASPRSPCFLQPEMAAAARPTTWRGRHLREVERALAEAGVAGALAAGILRFAPIVGAAPEEALEGHLRAAIVPVALGYDPRVQLVHQDDVVEALAHAVLTRFEGVAHIAGPGVLPLRRVLRMLGRAALPLPPGALRAALALRARLRGPAYPRLDAETLRFFPVCDTGAGARMDGFSPRRSIEQVLEALAAGPAAQEPPGRGAHDRERARLAEVLRRASAG